MTAFRPEVAPPARAALRPVLDRLVEEVASAYGMVGLAVPPANYGLAWQALDPEPEGDDIFFHDDPPGGDEEPETRGRAGAGA